MTSENDHLQRIHTGTQSSEWDPVALSADGPTYHLAEDFEDAYGAYRKNPLARKRDLLQYTIDFVNKTADTVSGPIEWSHPSARPVPGDRTRLAQLLNVAVHGPANEKDVSLSQPSDDFLHRIRQLGAELCWSPRLERTPTGAQWRHHVFVTDAQSFYALVAIALMDGPLRDEIRQCQYRICENFFFGIDRTRYCSSVCMKSANTQQSADRKNIQRARRILLAAGYERSQVQRAVARAFKDHPAAKATELSSFARTLLEKTTSLQN